MSRNTTAQVPNFGDGWRNLGDRQLGERLARYKALRGATDDPAVKAYSRAAIESIIFEFARRTGRLPLGAAA